MLPDAGTAHSALARLLLFGTAWLCNEPKPRGAWHTGRCQQGRAAWPGLSGALALLGCGFPVGKSRKRDFCSGESISEGRGCTMGRSWCTWAEKELQAQACVSHHKSTVEANLSLFISRLVKEDKSLRTQVRAEWSRQNRIQRVFNS